MDLLQFHRGGSNSCNRTPVDTSVAMRCRPALKRPRDVCHVHFIIYFALGPVSSFKILGLGSNFNELVGKSVTTKTITAILDRKVSTLHLLYIFSFISCYRKHPQLLWLMAIPDRRDVHQDGHCDYDTYDKLE